LAQIPRLDLQALHKLGKPRLIHCSAVDAPGLDRLTLAANTRGDNCVPDRAVTEEFHLHECFRVRSGHVVYQGQNISLHKYLLSDWR
jgi:hypothetical protein